MRDTPVRSVVVTDGTDNAGQSRTALLTVRALARGGFRPVVATNAPMTLASVSRYADHVVAVPPPSHPGYASIIRRLEADHLMTFATSDAALLALEPDLERFVDKELLRAELDRVGLPTPQRAHFSDRQALQRARGSLPYPIVVKPARGHGSRRIDGAADPAWSRLREDTPQPWIMQPYLTGPFRSIAGVMWDDRLVAVVHQRFHRTWPPSAGMASCGSTVAPDLSLERKVEQLLAGVRAVFEIDLLGDTVIDVNPRVYASLSLSSQAGANLPAIAACLAQGEPVAFTRARPGHQYRWLDADVRTTWADLRSGDVSLGDAVRRLLPLGARVARGGPESLTDPVPMFTRLGHAFQRDTAQAA